MHQSRHFWPARVLAAVSLVCATGSALAQAAAQQQGRTFWLQLGAWRAGLDSEVRYDRPGAPLSGTNLVLERELGLSDSKAVPSLQGGLRLGDRWRLELEHYSIKRSGSQAVLTGTIVIDDVSYPAAARLDSRFNTRVTRLGVGYSFTRSPTAEAGLTLGVHATTFELDIAGSLTAGGSSTELQRVDKSKTLPLPTVGAYASVQLAPKLSAAGRVDLLPIKAKGYKGDLVNGEANLVFSLTPNLAVGGGYRLVDYRVTGTGSGFHGRVQHQVRGPQLFAQVAF